jgi:hypothetical protein
MNEHQVREHVRKLRRFYTDALIYLAVNIGLILIWAISGGGYFWPIWVIIGWGIGLGVHAFSLGLIPQMNAMVPFMTAEWEDKEIRRLMEAGYREEEKKEDKQKKMTPRAKSVKAKSTKKPRGKTAKKTSDV